MTDSVSFGIVGSSDTDFHSMMIIEKEWAGNIIEGAAFCYIAAIRELIKIGILLSPLCHNRN